MNFKNYINWIINNPTNFKFIHNWVEDRSLNNYQIWYKNPDTSLTRIILSFTVDDNFITDSCTGLQLVYLPESNLNLEKLESLCKEDKYF